MSRILIAGGTLIDGTGSAPVPANVFIQNDKVLAVGAAADTAAGGHTDLIRMTRRDAR